jgi:hypothetical protein
MFIELIEQVLVSILAKMVHSIAEKLTMLFVDLKNLETRN